MTTDTSLRALVVTLVLSGSLAAQSPAKEYRGSIDWLVATLEAPEWQESNARLGNDVAKRAFTEGIVAYLLELYPEEEAFASLRDELREKIGRRLARPASMFGTWTDGAATLYLAERSARGAELRTSLRHLIRRISLRQNAEGGWAHGSGLSIEIYPTTLVSASAWSLLGLGVAATHEVKGAKAAVDEAIELLRDVQAASGGLPYGGRPYRKGVEAGRSAAALVALSSLGLGDEPWVREIAVYLRRNLLKVPQGHASPAMHVLMGALAAGVLGADEQSHYRREVLVPLLARRLEDQSLDDVLGSGASPDYMALMGDSVVARAYVTALVLAALCSEHSQFLASLDRIELPPREPLSTRRPPTLWQRELESVHRMAYGSETLALKVDDELLLLDPKTGEERHRRPLVGDRRLIATGKRLLAVPFQSDEEPSASSLQERMEADQPKAPPTQAFDLASAEELWRQDTGAWMRRAWLRREGLLCQHPSGRVRLLDSGSGEILGEWWDLPATFSPGVVLLADGAALLSDGKVLKALDAEGEALWTRRSRSRGGVKGSSYTAVVGGELLHIGESGGRVRARDPESGRALLDHRFESSILGLALVGSDRLAVLCGDGFLYLLNASDYSRVASFDVGRRGESLRAPGLVVSASELLVVSPAGERIVALDAKTLDLRAEWAITEGARVAIAANRIFVAEEGVLRAYAR